MELLKDEPIFTFALTVVVALVMVVRTRWRHARQAEDRIRYDPGRYI